MAEEPTWKTHYECESTITMCTKFKAIGLTSTRGIYFCFEKNNREFHAIFLCLNALLEWLRSLWRSACYIFISSLDYTRRFTHHFLQLQFLLLCLMVSIFLVRATSHRPCTLFHRDFIFLQTKIHNNNRNNSRKTRAWFAFLSSNFTIVTVTENRRTQHEHTNNANPIYNQFTSERARQWRCLDSENYVHAIVHREREHDFIL